VAGYERWHSAVRTRPQRFPEVGAQGATGHSLQRDVAKKEQVGQRGYAAGFQGLVSYIADQLPNSEVIQDGIRMDELLFPQLVIRELVANALVHQDLTITGAGPMIEIFDDRLEITNPACRYSTRFASSILHRDHAMSSSGRPCGR
jgi:predicted HTH transcriptional regulator